MVPVLVLSALLAACDRPTPKVQDLFPWPENVPCLDVATSPPPAREGNQARLLTNGEASFLERMRLIDEARSRIYLQALIFKADTVGTETARRLIARKKANPELDIRVIVDAYSNIQDLNAQILYFEMVNAGIDVQGFEAFYLHWLNEVDWKDWTAGNKRYHEKYLVVDGERAVVGGMNVGDEYARIGTDPALIWRDQDVVLAGPVVGDVEQAFLDNFAWFSSVKARWPEPMNTDRYWDLWQRIHPGLREVVSRTVRSTESLRKATPAPFDAADLERRQVPSTLHDNVRVQFVRSRPRVKETWIDQAYRARIQQAQHSVVLANAYFVPTQGLLEDLLAAARRGVQVTIITNSKMTNDIPIINDVGRLSYLPLMTAGAHVWEWHAEKFGEGTIHAKLGVFDQDAVIVGSYNLDPRSLALNSEDVVLIDDPRIAVELYGQVLGTDLRFAEEITLDQARTWSDPNLAPVVDVPSVPWFDSRFDPRQLEVYLVQHVGKGL